MAVVHSLSLELPNSLRWGISLPVSAGSACCPEEILCYQEEDAGKWWVAQENQGCDTH